MPTTRTESVPMRATAVALTTSIALALGLLAATPAAAADASVTGIVSVNGIPRGGVEVGWLEPSTGDIGEVATIADGSYVLPVPAGKQFVLYAGYDHAARKEWKRVKNADYIGVFLGTNGQDYLYQYRTAFAPANVTGANLNLDTGGTVTATAKSLDGMEVTKVDGQAVDGDYTDNAGSISVSRLVPGHYKVRAIQKTKAGTNEWFSRTITVTSNATTALSPDFSGADDAKASISGRITVNGKPVKGIQVSAVRGSTGAFDTTDSKGRYTLTGLKGVRYNLYLGNNGGYGEKNEYLPEKIKVTLKNGQKRTVNRSLEEGTTLTGSVTGAKKGFLRITVLDENDKVLTGRAVQVTKATAKKTFHLNGVPAGTHRIVITDGKNYTSTTARVSGAKTSIGARSLERKTITLTGTTSKSKYTQIFYTLGTRSERGDEVDYPTREYVVAKNGKYTLKGVIPGAATIDVSAPDHELRTIHFTATTSGTKKLSAGKRIAYGKISGTVTLGGLPLGVGYGSADKTKPARSYGSFEVKNGAIVRAKINPGKVRLSIGSNNSIGDFVDGSPFILAFPDAKSAATVRAGKTTDIGSVELVVER